MKKLLINVLAIIITILIIACRVRAMLIKNNYYSLEEKKKNEFFDENDKEIKKEEEYYSFYMGKIYEENYKNPYVLEGFKHIEGEWNTGFVIEDGMGNQFVWIPLFNEEKEDVAKLVKRNFIIHPIVPTESCFNCDYAKFIKSALENGGFYISRYETRN